MRSSSGQRRMRAVIVCEKVCEGARTSVERRTICSTGSTAVMALVVARGGSGAQGRSRTTGDSTLSATSEEAAATRGARP